VPGILLFSGCYQAPFDEGVKLVAYHLRQEMACRTPVTAVTTADVPADGAIQIPRGMAGFYRAFRRMVRTVGPEAVIYVPDAFLDRWTLARCGLMRLAAGRTPIAMVTLQPNVFDLPVRLMLRLWRPDVILAPVDADPARYARYGIRFETLPPAVDTDRFRPVESAAQKARLRQKYGLPESGPVCLHVGHIRRSRNVDWLLDLALPETARLAVVGSTTRALENDLADALRSRGAVVIDSYVPAIEELYQLADVYLFPVRQEKAAIDMPLSVLEAMACNLPVVSTPFGGLPVWFSATAGVWLVGSKDEFQAAVSQALASRACDTRRAVESHAWRDLADFVWNSARRT
jgi:glycosyltransferase involved in cell wall biosynthesis